MIDIALLAGFAVLVGCLGPKLLSASTALKQSPRLGISVWLACLLSTAVATTSAVALLALDSFSVRDLLFDSLRACISAVHEHFSDVPVVAKLALFLVTALIGWFGIYGALLAFRMHGARHRHRSALDLIGTRRANLGITVLEHPGVNAYCIPGCGGRIVVTTGAVAALSAEQLGAVIAHERAHLSGRHHLVTGLATLLAHAVPVFPLTRKAPMSVRFLVERLADERACRQVDRRTLASALLAVGSPSAPAAALGVGGGASQERVRLLVTAPGAWRRVKALLAYLLISAVATVPLVITASALTGLVWTDHCLLTASA